MEGVKILSEEVIKIGPDWLYCLIPVIVVIGVLALVFLAHDYGTVSSVLLAIFFIGVLFLYNSDKEIETEVKLYKITPTEENYHINLTKYEVLEVEQNIITVRERVE